MANRCSCLLDLSLDSDMLVNERCIDFPLLCLPMLPSTLGVYERSHKFIRDLSIRRLLVNTGGMEKCVVSAFSEQNGSNMTSPIYQLMQNNFI